MESEDDLTFQLVAADQISSAHEIEVKSFPPDEAGSLEAFRERQRQCPSLFLGAFTKSDSALIGYICATRSSAESLDHDSMSTNDPTGRSVCIHAVAVSPPFRKRGVASALMRNYVERMQTEPDVDRLLLICHDDLVQFYEQCGFKYVGKSHVVHGARAWFEMCLEISTSTAPQSISPEVFAALKKPAPQHPLRYLDSFSSLSAVRDSSGLNAHDLICPRVGCGSIILKSGVADLAIPSPEPQLPPELPRLPDPWTGLNANHEEWWLITPSPMSFENVSFSKPTQSQGGSSTPIKYLGCAECDLGPLGWCKATGGEFWLAPSRVGYKV